MFNVAERISALRKAHDLSQRALAEAAGISAAALSQIESGQASPSVATLEKLADGLNLGISAFFLDPSPDDAVEIIQLTDRPAINLHGQSTLFPLGAHHQQIGFEPILVQLQPGGEFDHDLYGIRSKHAYAWVRRGNAIFSFHDKQYAVSETHSVYYDPSQPHNWHNNSDSLCELLIVRSHA